MKADMKDFLLLTYHLQCPLQLRSTMFCSQEISRRDYSIQLCNILTLNLIACQFSIVSTYLTKNTLKFHIFSIHGQYIAQQA